MTTVQNADFGSGTLNAVVARRVRGLRAEFDITQAELGRQLGIKTASVSERLRGVTKFDINELPVLADVFGVSIEYLLGLTDERENRNPRPAVPDGGAVRHQGLEPRTRWLRARVDRRAHLRLIPAPVPPEESSPARPAAVVDLAAARRIRTAS